MKIHDLEPQKLNQGDIFDLEINENELLIRTTVLEARDNIIILESDSAVEELLGSRGMLETLTESLDFEESDMSGIMHAARHYNREFKITAKTAEGQTKRYRVKAQSERVAREKFQQHYNQAEIVSVVGEAVEEALGYNTDPDQAKWYHAGRQAHQHGTTGATIQDLARKHGVPDQWLDAFRAGYRDQEGWNKKEEGVAEGWRQDQYKKRGINSIMDLVKPAMQEKNSVDGWIDSIYTYIEDHDMKNDPKWLKAKSDAEKMHTAWFVKNNMPTANTNPELARQGDVMKYKALIQNLAKEFGEQGVAEGGVKQLPTQDADYSKYDTDTLKMMLRPGILNRNEARFKALIRKELQKREQQGVAEGSQEDTSKEWYDREGNLDPNGAFDAAGHYYAERDVNEAKYGGREVKLGKPMSGDVRKYKVYVKNPKTGNIKKVNFGDPNMQIRRDNPKARKSFRARHGCGTARASDRTKAAYWSCRMWSSKPVSKILKGK